MDAGTTVFGGAAALGFVAACWNRVKFYLNRLTSLAFVKVTVEGETARAIMRYCWREMRRSPFGERRYGSMGNYVRPLKRHQIIAYETLGRDPIVFWKGWRPIVISSNTQQSTGGSGDPGIKSVDSGTTVITCIRGLFNIEKLIIDALDGYNERNDVSRDKISIRSRFRIARLSGSGALRTRMAKAGRDDPANAIAKVADTWSPSDPVTGYDSAGDFRILKWKDDEIGAATVDEKSAFQALVYPPEVENIIDEIRRWKKSEDWYRAKMIPWRWGLSVYGPGGTGKSSLVKAIAQELGLPIYIFDLGSMDNNELRNNWNTMQQNVPCIALFEDLDNIYHGRENILGDDGGGVSFDCLLNCISGVETADGVLLFVCTNQIDKLDPALGVPRKDREDGDTISTRPGRIDRAVELKEMTQAQREKLANYILSDCPHRIAETVAKGEGDTGAQFQFRCGQIALAEYWKKEQDKLSDLGYETRKDVCESATTALPVA